MNKILLILAAFSLLLIAGCTQTVEEVKTEDMIGENVAVSGTVLGSIKIGELSAYTIEDKNGDEIAVASASLPADGDKVTARGELKRVPLIGYYIDSNN